MATDGSLSAASCLGLPGVVDAEVTGADVAHLAVAVLPESEVLQGDAPPRWRGTDILQLLER
eukprot:15483597-Alexandrium_andersonii.AAC.1